MDKFVEMNMENRKTVTLCNHNYSHEGVWHPDRIMDDYDLLYMQQGEWDIYEEDECYHVVSDTLLILEPGKHHYSKERCSPEMRNVYIHIRGDVINPQNTINMKKNKPVQDDMTSHNNTESTRNFDIKGKCLKLPKIMDCSNNKSILHGFEQVIESFWLESQDYSETYHANSSLKTSILVDNLLMEISEAYKSNNQSTDLLISEITHRFYCESYRFFSPEELARDYNVSVRTISGRFKKVTGQSIHQYQQRMKLQMAYDELPLNPGRGLKDIAMGFGFYDEFQFSKLFKRQFNISPSQRRQGNESKK